MIENHPIRDLKIRDFFRLHKMYDSLNEEKTRPFFNLYWLGLTHITLKWFLAQFPLFLSTIRIFRQIVRHIYPFIIFLSKVAVNRRDGIISYGFLIVRERLESGGVAAELGICVADEYQGKSIGSEMMKELIQYARNENIKEIFLTTRVDNIRARKLYKTFGFREERILKNEVEWREKGYDMYRMSLSLEER